MTTVRFGTVFHFKGTPQITAPIVKWATQELQTRCAMQSDIKQYPGSTSVETPCDVSTTDELLAITKSIQGFLSQKNWKKPVSDFLEQWCGREGPPATFDIDLSHVNQLDGPLARQED